MDCITNSALFLRANGNLVCWDDGGVNKVLQAYNSDLHYGRDVYLGNVYSHIRKRLADNEMPFPAYCEKCMVLNAHAPFDARPGTDGWIRYFQVESSFACNLKCLSCYPGVDRAQLLQPTPAGHLHLNPRAFAKIIADLKDADITVDLIEFQGHGEPLMNKGVWQMVGDARQAYPDSEIRIVTNSNFPFADHMVSSGVSEMVFAIDGIDQASYTRYRRGGSFERAYAFMRAFCHAARREGQPVKTVWKYVLFAHNSSDAQLARLLHLAQQAGVQSVQFIVTQLGATAKRFFKAFMQFHELPVTDVKQAELVGRLPFDIPLRDIDGVLRKKLGYSPFPELLGQQDKVAFTVNCYLSYAEDLSTSAVLAKEQMHKGQALEAGQTLLSIAVSLWRLYDGRSDLIMPHHLRLMADLLPLVECLEPGVQHEIYQKLSLLAGFVPDKAFPRAKRRLPKWRYRFYCLPAYQVQPLAETGDFQSLGADPQFILLSHSLRAPSGRCRLRIQAQVLDGELLRPRLYVDKGAGFSEQDSILLDTGPLGAMSRSITLPVGLKRLRLDPGEGAGKFRLLDISILRLPFGLA